MADTKITDLTSETAATGDELVINDVTDTSDKKITVQGILDLVPAGGGFSTVFKTADETIQSDTTLTDDTDLQFSVDANSSYAFMMVFTFVTGANPDFKYGMTSPSGALVSSSSDFYAVNTTSYTRRDMSTTIVQLVPAGGASRFKLIIGYVDVGVTAGSITLQWAQNTSQAEDTTVQKNSWVMFKKLN